MRVLILCGGRGLVDPETRQRIPKALLQVGGRPLIWHIMKTFAMAGYNEFVLALGEGGDSIRRHFFYQHLEGRDVEVDSGTGRITYLSSSAEENWRIKMVDTGLNANTGSRIARCRRYLSGDEFFATYSDCLCNVSLRELIEAHRASRKVVTVTGVQPSSRFGTFSTHNGEVVSYTEETKMVGVGGYLNGGYMVMSQRILEHLDVLSECSLEREVFSKLAEEREVGVFPHAGFWHAVDTERDLQMVTELYLENKRPWLSLGGA